MGVTSSESATQRAANERGSEPDISRLPLHFLMTFGHCGIDWLHSLFDSHPQILIMPAFSFYRSWNAIGCERIGTVEAMAAAWREYIEHHPGMQVDRRKLFYDDATAARFFSRLPHSLEKHGLTRPGVFMAIHDAYAHAMQIDVSRLRVIVAQEHLTFPFRSAIHDFPQARIIHIVRDPRAAMAGSFRHQGKSRGYLLDFDFNLVTEMWLNGIVMWKQCKRDLPDRYRNVRNEDLHADLEGEMRGLAQWLGVDFSPVLLRSTFSSRDWAGESAWMTADNKYPEEYDVFYAPENVRQRWLAELDSREIAMAEFLTRDVMREFRYDRFTPDTPASRVRGFLLYLWPNRRLTAYWRREYPNIDDFDRVGRKLKGTSFGALWKHAPSALKLAAIVAHSMLVRFRNYFAPESRARRYA
jgi:hypothetical protein